MFQIRDIFRVRMMGCGLAAFLLVFPSLAHANSFSVLYSFCSQSKCTDGKTPYGGVIADQAGNLYGTTGFGGADETGVNFGGTVFKITPGGAETVLHSFCSQSNCTDGSLPSAGLIADKSGNLYGTTSDGGTGCSGKPCGTVFKLAPDGTESVLHSFCSRPNCADGDLPQAGLIADEVGNLYGTTSNGGANGCCDLNSGTVFKLAPDGTETVLHSFCSLKSCADGAYPVAGLIADKAGNLYGTTYLGGVQTSDPCVQAGCGTVFKLAPDGTESVLHSFCSQGYCPDGQYPLAGLIADSAGNLYSTTWGGGTNDEGTVFKIAPDGTETVLYSFCSRLNCADGAGPEAGLIADKRGNLYGTAGGGLRKRGFGVIFRLAPNGVESVIHYFSKWTVSHPNGGNSVAGLLRDNAGDLYGTTWEGGANNEGTVFKLTE